MVKAGLYDYKNKFTSFEELIKENNIEIKNDEITFFNSKMRGTLVIPSNVIFSNKIPKPVFGPLMVYHQFMLDEEPKW